MPEAMERTNAGRVLVVEDDAAIRSLLSTLLERHGFDVPVALDGEAGLRAVEEHDPDVVLLDVGLPKMDGHEVTRRLRADRRSRTLPVIMLTARSNLDDMVAGLDAGADDFVTKPFRATELLARIRSAVRMRRAILGMETAHAVVAALANAVEAKDVLTERHCQRLATLSGLLAQRIELPIEDREAIVYGALLHDVGKIGVPEAILQKPGALTEAEWAVVRRHPEIGERICRPLALSERYTPIVRHHHERWDGAGYPDGLLGNAIPIGARIVTLADALDAMTQDRPYRRARSLDAALTEIRDGSGRQFDPGLVREFIAMVEDEAAAFDPPRWTTADTNVGLDLLESIERGVPSRS
jgi:putative two-component system response regulator